jgi:hypothetical protein
MTASSPRDTLPRRGRTFGLFRILAPVLTALAFWLAVEAVDPARAAAALGQGTMMLAVTLYAFRLKGRPVTARPPVRFTPEAIAYVAILVLGATIWAAAMVRSVARLRPTLNRSPPSIPLPR